jgi:hypothetical protein
MPLLQDQELAQFFTKKTEEWEDKEERPLRASLTVSVTILMVGVLQEPHRGFSCLVFDLLRALASTVAAL